jgi:hypothetical protein
LPRKSSHISVNNSKRGTNVRKMVCRLRFLDLGSALLVRRNMVRNNEKVAAVAF